MGYSHGTNWTDEKIENAIKDVIKIAKINSMPTHTQMDEITGSMALSNAVSKHGGSKYWSEKLGLNTKSCESKLGYEYECECMHELISLGYDVEFTKARYPYDLIANGNIKIDVKCSNLYQGKYGNFYTFNLEKAMPTCDVFVCYCLNENSRKVYVIPSCVLSGKTQLSIGETRSKYDKYINNWDIIFRYEAFYLEMIS